jgi:hypothetical protein
MSLNNFVAQNELEKILLIAMEGEMDADDFMQQLLNAQVYMPIQDETDALKGFPRATKTQSLIVENEEGMQALVLFTSPGRAKEFTDAYPGFGGGLLMEFNWVLRKLGTPMNIALNPVYEVGFDMDAEMVAGLMADLPPEQ